jgi:hypothetical protein
MGLNSAGLTALLDNGADIVLHAAIGSGPFAADQVSAGRAAVTLTGPVDGVLTADGLPLQFAGNPGAAATHLLLFSAASGGTFYGAQQISGANAFSASGAFRVPALTLTATTPAIPLGFPDASNTGLAGVGMTEADLTLYVGPGGYDQGGPYLLEDQLINDDIRLYASVQMVIRRCKINGHVDVDSVNASLLMEDCHIDATTWSNAAVGFQNLTIRRCDIEGGITAVNASLNSIVEDSYLHGQYIPPSGDAHAGGFLCSGGGGIELTHNTIVCDVVDNGDGGGPSNNLNLFGDLAELDGILIDGNYFPVTAGGYSVSLGHNPGKPFGDTPSNIVFTNNVLARDPDTGKGGVFGTVTSFLAGSGNVYSGNVWADDGTPVPVNA